jgi:hypothetical protein
MMENELIVSEESVRSIITTDLGKKKILQSLCHTVFMMRKNSDIWMPAKILCIDGEPCILNTIITWDESLCFSMIIGENQASEFRFGTFWLLAFA